MYGSHTDFSSGGFSPEEPRAAFQMLQIAPRVSSSRSFTAPDRQPATESPEWGWKWTLLYTPACAGSTALVLRALAPSPAAGRGASLPCHGHPVQQDPAGCPYGCSRQCWLAFANPNSIPLELHSLAFGLSVWSETDPNTAEWPYTGLFF